MKAPNMICDSVCQFASSFFSKGPMSFIASVDIGTVPFLRVFAGFFGGLVTMRSAQLRAINHMTLKMYIVE